MPRTRRIPAALTATPLVLAAALLLAKITAAVVPPYSPSAPSPFESHWRDGKAELDGYRYTVIRYGEERQGQAVMVFVTEPMSESKRVKVDDPRKDPADTFEALKLNFVRDFQTGIYDYNTMVSLFVRSRDFSPVKLALSAMEWCGSVYDESVFEPRRITDTLHSYFEGESGTRILDERPGGLPRTRSSSCCARCAAANSWPPGRGAPCRFCRARSTGGSVTASGPGAPRRSSGSRSASGSRFPRAHSTATSTSYVRRAGGWGVSGSSGRIRIAWSVGRGHPRRRRSGSWAVTVATPASSPVRSDSPTGS